MEIVLGYLRLGFLAIITLFFIYVLWILYRNLEGNGAINKEKNVCLTVLSGENFLGVDPGHRFILEERCPIGRGKDNLIIIDDPFASNFHALVLKKKNKFYLSDLNSKNGTLYNKKILKKEVALKNKDTIQIGDVVLKFEIH